MLLLTLAIVLLLVSVWNFFSYVSDMKAKKSVFNVRI